MDGPVALVHLTPIGLQVLDTDQDQYQLLRDVSYFGLKSINVHGIVTVCLHRVSMALVTDATFWAYTWDSQRRSHLKNLTGVWISGVFKLLLGVFSCSFIGFDNRDGFVWG